jgi:hypothetical protein
MNAIGTNKNITCKMTAVFQQQLHAIRILLKTYTASTNMDGSWRVLFDRVCQNTVKIASMDQPER